MITVIGSSNSSFIHASPTISVLLIVLATVTIIVGEIGALKEKNIKKLLAFSSIGQMGLVAVGL